eukprot:Gb_26234 [translate_table: standard]
MTRRADFGWTLPMKLPVLLFLTPGWRLVLVIEKDIDAIGTTNSASLPIELLIHWVLELVLGNMRAYSADMLGSRHRKVPRTVNPYSHQKGEAGCGKGAKVGAGTKDSTELAFRMNPQQIDPSMQRYGRRATRRAS